MKPYIEFLRDLKQRPAIVAHRGAWRQQAENSVPGLLAAADMGCEIGEIDVQLSADGHLFLLHDDDLARMTGHSATAQELPISEIVGRRLRHGMGEGKDSIGFSDAVLPRFEELLEAVRGRIYLDVDVKHGRNLAAVAEAISEAGMSSQAAIKTDFTNEQDAIHLQMLRDEHCLLVMPKIYFEEHNTDDLLGILAGLQVPVCETKFDQLETITSRREQFERLGIAVWVNTLDIVECCGFKDSIAVEYPDEIWGVLVEGGVSLIQTDYPEKLHAWRQRKAKI